MANIDELLIDLETRIAYQEDAIDQLNKVIFKQDQAIQQLEKGFNELCLGLRELKQSITASDMSSDDKPPHY